MFSLNTLSPAYVLATGLSTSGMQFSSPVQSAEVGEGRNVNWYGIYDNANWVKGRHTVSFGFQTFQQRVGSFNFNGAVPTYTIGISSASPYGFTAGNIPGASSTDVSRANGLLATLAGPLTSGSQQFNPTSPTSGFVKGAPQVNNIAFNNYALYVLDNFKVMRNLTLTLGLRWDYFPPVDETSGLIVQPVVQSDHRQHRQYAIQLLGRIFPSHNEFPPKNCRFRPPNPAIGEKDHSLGAARFSN